MSAIFVILVFLAIGTFAYLVWRVGWAEAMAATIALFGAIMAAIYTFAESFTP